MTSKPAFVLVPGAWHSASIWDKVSTLLKAEGFKTSSVTLPTTNGSASSTFEDDVKATQDAIRAHTSQKRDVIVIVHSYGGVVGQSAMKGFTKASSSDPTSEQGHIIGLICIATGYAQEGTVFLDGTGGVPPPIWRLDPSGFAELEVPARELFYHDLPEAEGDEWVAKLTKQSSRAFTEGRDIVYAGWKDVPVWHVITVEDKALPVEMQRMLVGMAAGADVTMREISSSHSLMLSRPEEVVSFVLEATSAFTKT